MSSYLQVVWSKLIKIEVVKWSRLVGLLIEYRIGCVIMFSEVSS